MADRGGYRDFEFLGKVRTPGGVVWAAATANVYAKLGKKA